MEPNRETQGSRGEGGGTRKTTWAPTLDDAHAYLSGLWPRGAEVPSGLDAAVLSYFHWFASLRACARSECPAPDFDGAHA
jgi:hypothetical protein